MPQLWAQRRSQVAIQLRELIEPLDCLQVAVVHRYSRDLPKVLGHFPLAGVRQEDSRCLLKPPDFLHLPAVDRWNP